MLPPPMLPKGAGRDTVSTALAFPKSASVTVPPKVQLGRENGLVSVCTKEMKAQRCDQTCDGSVSSKEGKRLQPRFLRSPPVTSAAQSLCGAGGKAVGFAQQL